MKNPFRDLKQKIRWFWQRRTRGFDDRELWSLDCTIAAFIAPRLRALAKMPCCIPNGMGESRWIATLLRIADAMDLIAQYKVYEDHADEVEECLDLFRKYFWSLWY